MRAGVGRQTGGLNGLASKVATKHEAGLRIAAHADALHLVVCRGGHGDRFAAAFAALHHRQGKLAGWGHHIDGDRRQRLSGQVAAKTDRPVTRRAGDVDAADAKRGVQRARHCACAGIGLQGCGVDGGGAVHRHSQGEGAASRCRQGHLLHRGHRLQHIGDASCRTLTQGADLDIVDGGGLGDQCKLRNIDKAKAACKVDEITRVTRRRGLVEADLGVACTKKPIHPGLQHLEIALRAAVREVEQTGAACVAAVRVSVGKFVA